MSLRLFVITLLALIAIAFNYSQLINKKTGLFFQQVNIPDTLVTEYIPDTVYGDFDGDGKKDGIWLDIPDLMDEKYSHKNPPFINARLADKKFGFIKFESYYGGGYILNEGDLNGNGTDEWSALLYNEGSWGGVHVYSWDKKRKEWYQPVEPFSVWDGLGQENIYTDTSRWGYVIINEWSYSNTEGHKLNTKSVRISLR
ncbi:MAG: hypothetical protein ACOZCO_08310 [Bacteroidota bacterium]